MDRAIAAARLLAFDVAKAEVDRAFAAGPPTAAQFHLSSRLHLSIEPRATEHLMRAQRDIDAALKLDPRNAEFWITKAHVSEWLHQGEAAAAHLKRALALSPDHPSALSHRADMLTRTGRTTEATADLDRLIAIEPNNASAYLRRAEMYQAAGDFEQAERDAGLAIAATPQPAVAPYYFRAMLRAERGDRAAAITDLATIIEKIELDPRVPAMRGQIVRALLARSTLLRDRKLPDPAVADVMRAMQFGADGTMARIEAMLAGRGAEIEVGKNDPETVRRAVAQCLAEEDCADDLIEMISFQPPA